MTDQQAVTRADKIIGEALQEDVSPAFSSWHRLGATKLESSFKLSNSGRPNFKPFIENFLREHRDCGISVFSETGDLPDVGVGSLIIHFTASSIYDPVSFLEVLNNITEKACHNVEIGSYYPYTS